MLSVFFSLYTLFELFWNWGCKIKSDYNFLMQTYKNQPTGIYSQLFAFCQYVPVDSTTERLLLSGTGFYLVQITIKTETGVCVCVAGLKSVHSCQSDPLPHCWSLTWLASSNLAPKDLNLGPCGGSIKGPGSRFFSTHTHTDCYPVPSLSASNNPNACLHNDRIMQVNRLSLALDNRKHTRVLLVPDGKLSAATADRDTDAWWQ